MFPTVLTLFWHDTCNSKLGLGDMSKNVVKWFTSVITDKWQIIISFNFKDRFFASESGLWFEALLYEHLIKQQNIVETWARTLKPIRCYTFKLWFCNCSVEPEPVRAEGLSLLLKVGLVNCLWDTFLNLNWWNLNKVDWKKKYKNPSQTFWCNASFTFLRRMRWVIKIC